MNYRPEIDGLRAVAVLPVVLFHAEVSAFSGGFVGVDVFFVISGYLITSIILAEHQAGNFTLAEFYERRVRRILPALFTVMLACLPLAWWWLPPKDMEDFAKSLTSVATFSSNIQFMRESGYFDTATELKPLLHTWSLAVEEQYYVLFPPLILAIWRTGLPRIFTILLAISILSLLLAQWAVICDQAAAFYLLPMRGWELLCGALIASHASQEKPRFVRSHTMREILGITGLLLLATAIFTYDKNTPFPGITALLPTLGTGLIILNASADTLTGKLLSCKALVGLGLISYSTYLWHQPLFAFARFHGLHPSDQWTFPCLITLTLLLAFLTYRYIETPCRNRQWLGKAQVFWLAVGVSLCFIGIGKLGVQHKGFLEQRLSDSQKHLLASAMPSPKRGTCHGSKERYISPADACEYFGSNVTWATLGDSHTVELAYALAKHLAHDNIGIKHFSFSKCPPGYGRTDLGTACTRWTNASVSYLIEHPEIHTVVVSYRIHAALFGGEQAKTYPALPDKISPEERNARWRAYINLLQALVQSGKRVILVQQAPELPKRINELIFRNDTNHNDIPGVPLTWWNARSAYMYDHLQQIPPGVMVIDPARLFCDNAYCYAVRNGNSWYFDDNHISINGASIVVNAILAGINPQTR